MTPIGYFPAELLIVVPLAVLVWAVQEVAFRLLHRRDDAGQDAATTPGSSPQQRRSAA